MPSTLSFTQTKYSISTLERGFQFLQRHFHDVFSQRDFHWNLYEYRDWRSFFQSHFISLNLTPNCRIFFPTFRWAILPFCQFHQHFEFLDKSRQSKVKFPFSLFVVVERSTKFSQLNARTPMRSTARMFFKRFCT